MGGQWPQADGLAVAMIPLEMLKGIQAEWWPQKAQSSQK